MTDDPFHSFSDPDLVRRMAEHIADLEAESFAARLNLKVLLTSVILALGKDGVLEFDVPPPDQIVGRSVMVDDADGGKIRFRLMTQDEVDALIANEAGKKGGLVN